MSWKRVSKWNKDSLIVTVGRLEEAYSQGRIFVPHGSHLAKLIVLDAHLQAKYFGTAATLAELRFRYDEESCLTPSHLEWNHPIPLVLTSKLIISQPNNQSD